jgi:hypothetical protein
MVIFELPATRDRGDLRATSLGSCRVRNPITVLRQRGDLRIRAEGPTPTHTAAEARQSLAVALGQQAIPEALNAYIYESDHRPSADRVARTLREGIDVFLLEISDDKQFSYRDICLNQNFVTRQLVQPYRGALLDWYREISRGERAQESSVQTAIDRLRDGGFGPDEQMADLLRGIKLERCGREEIAQTLGAMISMMGGRWVVVGPFATPGDEGIIMQQRRAFNEALYEASTKCGALFYDPSQLLFAHGKETALAGGGMDIYEYAESFYPTLGETLVSLVRAVGPPRRRSASPAVGANLHFVRAGWAIGLEATASKLTRRVRRQLMRLGRGVRKLVKRR